VLISPAEFDYLSVKNRFIKTVENGLDDVANGRVLTDQELDRALDVAAMD
jgi:predicted transcriptional regulator